jgi:hypothetical protein
MNAFQSSILHEPDVWSCKIDMFRNKTNSNTSLRFKCFPLIFYYLTQETTTGFTQFSKQQETLQKVALLLEAYLENTVRIITMK